MFKIIKNVKNNIKTSKKEAIILFFFYIILIIFVILIITFILTTIQIHIQNVRISTKKERRLNKDYKIELKLFLLNKINYLKIDITKTKLEKDFVKRNVNKIKNKMEKDKNKYDRKLIKKLKKLNIKIDKLNLKIYISLKDAAINAISAGTLSGVFSVVLGKLMDNNQITEKDEISWKILPLYQDKNELNIELNCIISFKMIHIIKSIKIFLRDRIISQIKPI